MLKLLASCAVFSGCGYLGILCAGRLKKRVRQLDEFKSALTQLQFDIDYLGIPLAEAFERIAKNTESEIKNLFLYVSERLSGHPGCDMQKVWTRAISKYEADLAFGKEDIDVITDFSKTLGTGNCEKEKNNIKVTQMRLEILLNQARSEAESNTKIYRGLGFLTGIFLVVLLI